MNRYISTLIACLILCTNAYGQNTGGVFPPNVNEGHRSFQYRLAIDPDNAAGSTGFAQRLHYQQAINGDYMWRIIGQTRKTPDSDFDFDFVQAELFWEFKQPSPNRRSGVRFDVRFRDGDRPEQIGFNWMNTFQFGNNWSARALLLTSVQLGSNAASGVNLQTRGQIAKKLNSGASVGLEMFNNYGSTSDFGDFNEQSHTLGPILSLPLNQDFSIFTGALFGLSDAAPDTEFRLWITRKM